MVADGQNYLLNAWWITTLPGLVIVPSGVGFSLIGDGLADRLGERFRLADLTRATDSASDARRPRSVHRRRARRCSRCATSRRRSRRRDRIVLAADGVSLRARARARRSGIVGESGSGKSVTLRSLLGLVPEPGQIIGGAIGSTARTCSRLRRARCARSAAADRDDLPGPDEQPEPRLHGRRSDRRDRCACTSAWPAGGPRARRSSCSTASASRRRASASAPTRTSCPAACASA